MRYYCSGAGKEKGTPQELLPESRPNVMLTYYDRRKPVFLGTLFDFQNGVSAIESLFIDSGAFSLYQAQVKKSGYSFFQSDEFRRYLDQYGAFLKDAQGTPELFFSNLDVIGNAKLTRQTQKYLEENFGVRPVPVVHFPADNEKELQASLDSLEYYLSEGYEMIALGGFFRRGIKEKRTWCDHAFKMICPASKNFLPQAKIHGFAMTSHELICRYPWWSTDSTVWSGPPTYGWVYYPKWNKKKEIWDFSKNYNRLNFWTDSPEIRKKGKNHHYERQEKAIRKEFQRWLAYKGWSDIEFAMTELLSYRTVVNLLYWIDLQNSRPEWPHPFRAAH